MSKKGKKTEGPVKELHGNLAKVDPKKDVESLFATNTVTMSDRKDRETPLVDQTNVEYARDFVDENKK